MSPFGAHRGDQQNLDSRSSCCPSCAADSHPYSPVRRLLDQLDARFEADIHSPAEELSETLRYVGVLSPQQQLRAAEHGNGGSEGGENVGKLGRDAHRR